MSALLLHGGRVVDPANGVDGALDVLIRDGAVAAVGPGLSAGDATSFDATGKIVAPGFIDLRAHLREPGITHAETIETGADAAAAGGFTTVCAMPNTIPVNDNPTVTSYVVERAAHARVHVLPVGAITQDMAGEALASIGLMKEAGAVAISDDGEAVMDARVMRRAMEYAKSFELCLMSHCEDGNLSLAGDLHEGAVSMRLGLRGIPGVSEDVMVARDILLSELTGCRLHIAHISTASAVQMVREAKGRGVPVTCEATAHHFTLIDEDIPGYDSNYKMKPPLRGRADRAALLAGLADGTIDNVCTDHAPHTGHIKMQEFEGCPFGVTGLETAVGLGFRELVGKDVLGIGRLVELFTDGPRGVLSLDAGTLSPGAAADVTVLDPERTWSYDLAESHSRSRNSPFGGWEFPGGPHATFVAGELVWSAAGGLT